MATVKPSIKRYTVAPAPPYQVTLATTPGNLWWRAPLGVGVRPTISGGNPMDRITSAVYTLDGATVAGSSASFNLINIATAGTHTIGLTIGSSMGQSASATTQVTIKPDVPPQCSISANNFATSKVLNIGANCTDTDGYIVRYAWAVNGKTLSSNATLYLQLSGAGRQHRHHPDGDRRRRRGNNRQPDRELLMRARNTSSPCYALA